MDIARTIHEMKSLRHKLSGAVGFVPTMGFLHDGHLELIRIAKRENRFAIVSIFVNPTQFGPREDFRQYPRDLARDLAMLKGVYTDIVFIPADEEMYPPGYNSWVILQEITSKLEGKSRPTHFQGVTTVCNKLFNIVEPDKAYFGQKDAQQALVIQKMVRELNMNLEVVVCPTIREKDGLAMSSRNTYLTHEERQAAPVLYKSLLLAKEMNARGEQNADVIRKAMTEMISSVPQAQIDYISIASLDTLDEIDQITGKVLVSLAVKLGKPRLIDNIIIG